MKHIFFVHSHICFAIARAIIDKKSLPISDVTLITDRNYYPPNNKWLVTVVPPNELFIFERNILKGRANIKSIERYIKQISVDKFEYYCPHTLNPFSNFIIHHPNCVANHLIEEGTNSYLDSAEINKIHSPLRLTWRQKLWSFLFYSSRFKVCSFYPEHYLNAYCTSSHAFPGKINKVVLNIDFSLIYNKSRLDVSNILVLDSAVETKYSDPENYLHGIKSLIFYINNNLPKNTVIGIKLHPYQYCDRWFADRIFLILADALGTDRIVELAADTSIESVDWSGGGHLFLGMSSLSIYAKRAGCKCYSYARVIASHDEKYRHRLAHQPQAFIDSVNFF